MKRLGHISSAYFLGIGGIGMSALARYFLSMGIRVNGYDRTVTPLTRELEKEGIPVHYEDRPGLIPGTIDLVVYTPAVPSSLDEFQFLKHSGIRMMKRSEVLGLISEDFHCMAVAGSHGKTTTSTLMAHLMHLAGGGCLALLGGISKNYRSNFINDPFAQVLVTEADEYDRSFLQLSPSLAVITSVEPDHLDIYGTFEALQSSFREFIRRIRPGGTLLIKSGIDFQFDAPANLKVYTYGLDAGGNFHPANLKIEDNTYHFDLQTPDALLQGFQQQIPGLINVENATAALAACLLTGCHPASLAEGLTTYTGVRRRLDKRFDEGNIVYIDDYAHHPDELKACILSVKQLYPGREITGIFQPHLFSRTRDLASGFADSLALLDRIILLDIYPAREEPIPGVDSQYLFNLINHPDKAMSNKEDLLPLLGQMNIEVLLTLGAGDIDQLVGPIVDLLTKKTI